MPKHRRWLPEPFLLLLQHAICQREFFAHVHGAGFEVGKALVTHPHTKAVGFTGSYIGGKQLFDWGNQRKEPIPVFAEMGSVNPVFLLPGKLSASANEIATMYAGSITLGVGQFCTNPGLIIGIESEALKTFIHENKLLIHHCFDVRNCDFRSTDSKFKFRKLDQHGHLQKSCKLELPQ